MELSVAMLGLRSTNLALVGFLSAFLTAFFTERRIALDFRPELTPLPFRLCLRITFVAQPEFFYGIQATLEDVEAVQRYSGVWEDGLDD